MSQLITADGLHALLGDERLVVLDASWYLPADGRDTRREFVLAHIPGARIFDFDREICAVDTDLPHMLPSPADFTRHARRLGVNSDSRIVVYDSHGLFSAPRAWWMLRVMGHDDCRVLDGGLPAWIAAGHAVETGPELVPSPGDFAALPDPHRVVDRDAVLAAMQSAGTRIVDARPHGRFTGSVAEPRAGLRGGHIPGSVNLASSLLVQDGQLRPRDVLAELFAQKIDSQQRIIASCGSGVTASIIALAAAEAGYDDVAVYDGSWAEWGADDRLPVATGEG